jgi:hypothetical protein
MAQYEQTHYEEGLEQERLAKQTSQEEHREQELEIIVEPWKKLIIHELLEYKFEDLAKLVATQSVQQGGTAIPTISWAEGVAFLISPFPDESEVIIEEKLKGIIHYNTVLFALKKNFEAEIFMRGHEIRINLIDVGTNEIFKLLARKLIEHAKLPQVPPTQYSSRGSGAAGLQ